MGRSRQIERTISKGQLVPLMFTQGAVAASQAAVAMTFADGIAKVSEYVMPFDFEIVAITIVSDSARAGGSAIADATIDGTVTGVTGTLNATDTLRARARNSRSADAGTAGQRVGVKLTTDAGWLPITADIVVTVWVLVHLEGI